MTVKVMIGEADLELVNYIITLLRHRYRKQGRQVLVLARTIEAKERSSWGA